MIFIAPKNFKRGSLIANKYTIKDLMIAGVGISLSLFLEIAFLLTIKKESTWNIIIAFLLLIPAGISVLFVVPNGVYHNIFCFMVMKIMNHYRRKKYIWRGVETYHDET